jgi:hypothetical protein
MMSRLNPRSAEREEIHVAKEWLSKLVPATMVTHAAIEELLEAVFSMWSSLRLYREKKLELSGR